MKAAVKTALTITLLSWAVIRAGIWIGHAYPDLLPHSVVTDPHINETDLFRFDAEYYLKIATEGYFYNGDPSSSPNIVFAPLYPALIWLASAIPGVDPVSAGFVLNKLMLFLSLLFLFLYLRDVAGPRKAALILGAMATSAGAYAFHAYYSESTMLLAMSLCLYGCQRKNRPLMAAAAVALGASRLTGLPMALAASLCFFMGWRRTKRWQCLAFAALCPLGAAVYLGYIWVQFGNPFTLFPEIQKASWALFHPGTSLIYVLSGKNLLDFTLAAFSRGTSTFLDIKTLNLVWTLLAISSLIWSWRKFGAGIFNYMFTGYFLFIYVTGGGSDFLISSHRFYAMMLPIFMMITAAPPGVAALFFCVNLFYCLMHTAAFNQGHWFYF